MGSRGTAKFKSIADMLDICANGYDYEIKKHYIVIKYNGKTYPSLPKGEHSKSKHEIEKGHIRKMVRFLEIDEDCAKKHLPLLNWNSNLPTTSP